MDSILGHTKGALGVAEDDTAFDVEIIMHINNALSNLNDLGLGPEAGFVIEGADEVWDDFIPLSSDPVKMAPLQSKIKTYVYLKTRVVFDPPTNNPGYMAALISLIEQTEWRISVIREGADWVDPNPKPVTVEEEI